MKSSLLSITHAATFLNLTRKAVYDAISRGALERIYVDDKPFITRSSLEAFKKRKYSRSTQ